jgi:predicted O-linked N-acetylglucosamine transferase (SPINDLY family)
MDYIVADRVLADRHGAERFTERPLRLPGFYLGTIPPDAPPVTERPAGPVAFGSFNNPAKLSDETLRLWGRVLRRVPDSTLVLKYKAVFSVPECLARVHAALAAEGVAPDRVIVPAPAVQGLADHLALYGGIDIALDPFPFSGSTTTFEALVMGVPVVTLPGPTMVSRWSASMLANLGLSDLVARTPEAYVSIAAALAADTGRRHTLRRTLRERVAASPLCDGPGKARHMARAYRAVWRRWCRDANGSIPPGDSAVTSRGQ